MMGRRTAASSRRCPRLDRTLHPVNLPADWSPPAGATAPRCRCRSIPDAAALESALAELRALPPLVTSWEILALKQQLAEAQEGKRFLLQGGDCAESFADCSSDVISNRLKVLLQMSLVLVHGLRKPVVRVGRFAGQYAKPRSTDTETRDGVTLPSYRGDMVNAPEFTAAARTPDPRRMIKAHARSAMTMNFVRALIDGGFADLHHPEYWDLELGRPLAARRRIPPHGQRHRRRRALHGNAVGQRGAQPQPRRLLHLARSAAAAVRGIADAPGAAPLGLVQPQHALPVDRHAHRAVDGAHAEYFRGIRNPIALKVGPSVTPDQLLRTIDLLNPEDEPGRLTFIHRMGAAASPRSCRALLDAVRRDGRRVLWVCDPMHGNTESTSNGYKTRRFRNIRSELEQAFELHAAAGTRLGGVHLELTGEDVTECLGGARELTESDLERAYKSTVDPRLNYEQALEIAMLIVRKQAQIAAPA